MKYKIMVLFMALIATVFGESFRESDIFKIKKYKVASAKKELGKRIIFLSDLHNHVYGDDNEDLLETIKKEKPDLILIGGDMLIGKHSVEMGAALRFCSELPSIAPVYYALGNHEQRMKTCPEKYGTIIYKYIQKLENAGIVFLDNENAEVSLGKARLCITGLSLPLKSYSRKHRHAIGRRYIEKLVGRSEKDIFQILLAHDPSHFKSYKEWGADLTLSGHLHGGVARIPGWRGVITPQFVLFPKYSGEMTTEEEHTIIVSKGLGAHTIKFRIFNYPEIVVIDL